MFKPWPIKYQPRSPFRYSPETRNKKHQMQYQIVQKASQSTHITGDQLQLGQASPLPSWLPMVSDTVGSWFALILKDQQLINGTF